jgi:Rieske Fe-S protein
LSSINIRCYSCRKSYFGPAARPLPQLAITVDSEGYLVAKQPFTDQSVQVFGSVIQNER